MVYLGLIFLYSLISGIFAGITFIDNNGVFLGIVKYPLARTLIYVIFWPIAILLLIFNGIFEPTKETYKKVKAEIKSGIWWSYKE